MKKIIVLAISLWAMSGIGMAQDIYTCGQFVNIFGLKGSAVFKNEEVIFSRTENEKDLYSTAMAIDTMTGDIYWSSNSNPIDNIANGYGCVMKNNEVVLDNVIGTCVNDISFDGNDIYSAGYTNDIYQAKGAIWKNGETTPLYTFNQGSRSEVLGIVAVDGVIYACGYYNDGLDHGCVWRNGDLYATYQNQKVKDIVYYEGEIYYLVEDYSSLIYQGDHEYCTVFSNGSYTLDTYGLEIANDDIYLVGFMGFNDCCLWKNCEILYLHALARGASLRASQFYDQSIYYVGWDWEDHGIMFKDGEQIGSTKFQYYYDLCVRPNPLTTEEANTERFAIYPNPAQDNIVIKGANKGDLVSIYSATGQLVMTAMAEPNKEIEVSHLPSGLYMIRCGEHVSRFVKK
jgi:hypothetical protein